MLPHRLRSLQRCQFHEILCPPQQAPQRLQEAVGDNLPRGVGAYHRRVVVFVDFDTGPRPRCIVGHTFLNNVPGVITESALF